MIKTIDPAFAFLLKAQYENFFEKASARVIETDWRCKGCSEIVPQWKRREHFAAHKSNQTMIHEAARVAASLNKTQTGAETRTDICVQCGGEFAQERKRGRPRKKCFVCLPEKG